MKRSLVKRRGLILGPLLLPVLLGLTACEEDTPEGTMLVNTPTGGSAAMTSTSPVGTGGTGGPAAATAGGAGGDTGGAGGDTGGAGGDTGGAGGAGGAAGTGMDTTPGGPSGDPTFTAIYDEILTKGEVGNCMAGYCHGAAPTSMGNGNLQITASDKQGAYDNLVNVVSTSELCAGATLVIPGDSAGSLLLQKFSAPPPCGLQMPVGMTLTEAQITQIATWIDNGAMND
ncbi:MAG: hypothetical protein OEZ06_10065 [Myxococcales bacterium]|nr:hypothetical protein [Myxococcales bacterium]